MLALMLLQNVLHLLTRLGILCSFALLGFLAMFLVVVVGVVLTLLVCTMTVGVLPEWIVVLKMVFLPSVMTLLVLVTRMVLFTLLEWIVILEMVFLLSLVTLLVLVTWSFSRCWSS